MRKITFLFAMLVGGAINLIAQTQFHKSVYFDTDKHHLSTSSEATLQTLIDEILVLTDYAVEVKAHTDDRGSVAYNQALAERRAKSVADFLAKADIIAEKTTVKSFGELNPTFSNQDEAGRSKNRRVDVIVTAYSINSLDELFTRLSANNLQTFLIPSDRNVLLTAKNGTQFKIAAHTFQFSDGNTPTGDITLEIKEAYSYADMLTNDLSTTSNGHQLETGGMVYINAVADGKNLAIKDNANIEVGLPAPKLEAGMQLFTASTDANGNMDWQPTNQDYATDFEGKDIKLEIPKAPTYPIRPSTTLLIPVDKGPKPLRPAKPRKPIKPRKPQRSNIKYQPTFFEKLIGSKQKTEAKKDALFEKKMKKYHKSLGIYQQKIDAYAKALKKYDVDQTQYALAVKAWEVQPTTIRQELPKAEQKRNAKRYKKELAVYKQSYEVWKQLKEQAYQKYEEAYEEKGFVTEKDVAKYVYKVAALGWINCDRFRESTEVMTPILVNDADDVPERIFLVFKNINSMMRVNKVRGKYRSSQIPVSEEITILGLKVINGRTYLAKLDTRADAQYSYNLKYMPCTLKELRKELSRVNS